MLHLSLMLLNTFKSETKWGNFGHNVPISFIEAKNSSLKIPHCGLWYIRLQKRNGVAAVFCTIQCFCHLRNQNQLWSKIHTTPSLQMAIKSRSTIVLANFQGKMHQCIVAANGVIWQIIMNLLQKRMLGAMTAQANTNTIANSSLKNSTISKFLEFSGQQTCKVWIEV